MGSRFSENLSPIQHSSLVPFSAVALDSEISCILEFKANKLKKLIFIQDFHEIEINEAVVKV
jgi:hypothetical protein